MESPIRKTLQYFDKYDYPLTKKELEYWAGAKVKKFTRNLRLEKIRSQREKYSKPKWKIAFETANKLSKINFIEAVFVTGSLSMSNCKKTDDIDLMIITKPNTLWITRFIVNTLFINNRRFPNQKIAPNKICMNLWLDTNNLKLKTENLYIAHEVLQAKCIYNKNNTHANFLYQNSWVKNFLPKAYQKTTCNLKFEICNLNSNFKFKILNYVFFLLQYLYMKPKMTTEKVGLGYAFFHPGKIDK